MTFRFDLKQTVRIAATGETGTVQGRADYTNSPPAYLLRYVDKHGSLAQEWYGDDVLEPAPASLSV